MSCDSHLDDQTPDEWRWRALQAEQLLAAYEKVLAEDRAEDIVKGLVASAKTFGLGYSGAYQLVHLCRYILTDRRKALGRTAC